MKHEDRGYAFLSQVADGLPDDVRKEVLEEQEQWRRSVPPEVHAMQRGSLAQEDQERLNQALARIAEKLGIQDEVKEILDILRGRQRSGHPAAGKSQSSGS